MSVLTPGMVATLRDGKYYSDYSGRSHVGIYQSHDEYQEYLNTNDSKVGVLIFDQFNGSPITKRTYHYAKNADAKGKPARRPWGDSEGITQRNRVNWMKDGEEYYVLLV